MSKEEYANEIKRLAYHYNKGKEDERKRILKLIDEKIKETKSLEAYKEAMLNITKYPKTYHECIGRLNGFKDLKEELTEK